MSQKQPDGNSKAVLASIRILDYLAATGRPIGVRQFAFELGMSRSTCMRLLATLASRGVVEQVAETSRYELGWRVLAFASAYQRSNSLVQVSQNILLLLAAATGETSCLYVPAGGGRALVLQIESDHELRYTAQTGRVHPLYLGAAGKALLAHMPQATIEYELRRCATERGEETAQRVAADLVNVRASGYATSSGETIPGVAGIAMPVFTRGGVLAACLSVYGPTSRVDDAAIARLKEPVLRATQEISAHLGERAATQLVANPAGTPPLFDLPLELKARTSC